MSECRSVRKWSSHHSHHPIQSSSFDGFAKFPLFVEEIVSKKPSLWFCRSYKYAFSHVSFPCHAHGQQQRLSRSSATIFQVEGTHWH